MVSEKVRIEIIRELGDVQVAAEVTLLDGNPRGGGERAYPVALIGDEPLSQWAGSVVELVGGGDEEAPAGHGASPGEPVLEERADAGNAARLLERGGEDGGDEAVRRGAEHLELQVLLRVEVGEESALRKAGLARKTSDAQALETDPARQIHRAIQDGRLRLLAFGHLHKIVRSFCSVKP